MGYQGRDRQRNRRFFSGMFRGVSHPCEGSKILMFLFGPRLECSSLLHRRSSRKVDSANNFAFTEFSEACSLASTRNLYVIGKILVQTMQQIRLEIMLYSDTARKSMSAGVRTS